MGCSMKVFNKIKDIFKKTPRKQTVTFKTTRLGFIGKTKTIDILSEQEVDKKIEQAIAQLPPGGGGPPFDPAPLEQEDARLQQEINNLNNRVPKLNQDNDFRGTQTFEFAKVERVPGNHQFEVINWGVFNTRATNIEGRVTALEQRPPGGGGGQPFDPTPLQNEDRRLQQEINKSNQKIADNLQEINRVKATVQDHDRVLQEFIRETNEKFNRLKWPKTITTPESSSASLVSNDIESYSVGNGVWNFKITNSKTVTFNGSAVYNDLASRIEADNNEPIKVRVGNIASAFVIDRNNFRVPVGTVEIRTVGKYPIELTKNSGTFSITIQNARGIATGDPKTVLRSIMCYCVFFRTLN